MVIWGVTSNIAMWVLDYVYCEFEPTDFSEGSDSSDKLFRNIWNMNTQNQPNSYNRDLDHKMEFRRNYFVNIVPFGPLSLMYPFYTSVENTVLKQ